VQFEPIAAGFDGHHVAMSLIQTGAVITAKTPTVDEGSRIRRRWLAHVLVVIGLVTGALALWAVIGFVAFTRSIATAEPQKLAKTDGIVVLTGGAQRLSDGMALLAAGHGQRLLISGVNARAGRDEILPRSGLRHEKLECCVDLGKGARNTIGNAIETRRWARSNGFRSLLVVTSNYHMPRTLAEFQHVMGDIELVGYPVVSEPQEPARPSTMLSGLKLLASEYTKYQITRLRQLLETDPEHSRLPVLMGRQKPVGIQVIERPAQP
jgi:uncharacterized SAM-binding protein YcdF (DUF218 family)